MENNKIMLDTDILFNLFKGDSKIINKVYSYYSKNFKFFISAITLYEYLRGSDNNPDLILKKRMDLLRVLTQFEIDTIEFNSDMAHICASQWANLKKAGCKNVEEREFDILIGGSSYSKKLPLMTENKKDFKDLYKIELI